MFLSRALLLTTLLTAFGASASTPRVVMVLYFDNNTGDPSFDVLQKGLADMLITDLAGTDAVQVVEREKLQAAIDELKLQRTKYFDPKTAQSIGKGIGARYAITGAMHSIDPQLRIETRMFDLTTQKVVLGSEVRGTKDQFFELETQLVQKFLAKLAELDARAAPTTAPRAGQTTVATLLEYSQALDAADTGDLKAASQKMAAVVRSAPDFALAKQKYGELLKRLREAGKRRKQALSEAEEKLIRRLTFHLSPNPGELDRSKRSMHFGARYMRGVFLAKQLEKMLTPTDQGIQHLRDEHRADADEWTREYVSNYERLIAEMEEVEEAAREERLVRLFEGTLPLEDRTLLQELSLPDAHNSGPYDVAYAQVRLAEFLFTGRTPESNPFRPSPAQQDPKYAKFALELIAKAQKRLTTLEPLTREQREAQAIDLAAEGLVLLGRKEEAVAQWQLYLDTWPKGSQYGAFEAKIEELLEVSPAAEQFEQLLASCPAHLSYPLSQAVQRRGRAEGRAGLVALEEKVRQACKGKMFELGGIQGFLIYAGQSAAGRGDCAHVKELRAKVDVLGERSRFDFDRMVPQCQ